MKSLNSSRCLISLTLLIALTPASAISTPPPNEIEEVVIAGGHYYVGSVFGEHNYSVHTNTYRDTFSIMTTEVTYHFYQSVVAWGNEHGYSLNDGCNGAEYEDCQSPDKDNGRHPVTNISWWDAILFANALSEMRNLKPVYLTVNNQPYRNSEENREHIEVHLDFTSTGYRLPDQAEWQIAARGGNKGLANGTYGAPFSGSQNANEVAVFPQSDLRVLATSPVASLKANAAGLYDMSGNVSEWLGDSIIIAGGKRMYYFCGGSYLDRTSSLASCDVHTPGFLTPDTGFRLVRRVNES